VVFGGVRLSSFVDIVLPVFALVGIGYGAAFVGLFDDASTRALSRFVFQIALPVMLFSRMAAAGTPTDLAPGYLVAYFVGVAVCSGLGALAAAQLGRQRAAERIIVGFAASYGNVILLGIPLVLRALGDTASLPLFLLVSFHGPIMMTLVTILLERDGTAHGIGSRLLGVARGLGTNPILIGLLGGIAFAASGLTLPLPIAASAELLGQAALPTALFAMGASLAGYRIRGALRLALVVVGLKTILQPLAVWLLVDYAFVIASPWSDTAILLAAMPTGVNAYLFATRYRAGEPEAATAIILSTAFALLTVSVILALRLG
jgi:predicted permease